MTLLLVLATTVLLVAAAVTLAQIASTEKLRQRLNEHGEVALDLALACEAPIIDWLKHESAHVALLPDAAEPTVEILHDLWIDAEVEHEVCITAWDQCGMLPSAFARGSLLRAGIPAEVVSAIDGVQVQENDIAGLDLFELSSGNDVRIFPASRPTEPVGFGEAGGQPDGATLLPTSTEHETKRAIGAYIATHNPATINVNTAPIDLLEAAMRQTGRGGIDQILETRRQGKAFQIAGTARQRGQRIILVSSSSAWAFRIDIRVGQVRQSWWCICENAATESGWKLVQRLAIYK